LKKDDQCSPERLSYFENIKELLDHDYDCVRNQLPQRTKYIKAFLLHFFYQKTIGKHFGGCSSPEYHQKTTSLILQLANFWQWWQMHWIVTFSVNWTAGPFDLMSLLHNLLDFFPTDKQEKKGDDTPDDRPNHFGKLAHLLDDATGWDD